MRYGLGYLVKVKGKSFEFQPDIIGDSGILRDLETKEYRLVKTTGQALAMSEKDVKALIKSVIF